MLSITILLGVGTGTAGAATNEVSALLQQGLFEEEANQNLDAAIQAYQSVIAQTDKNRQFAATAIFRLGECYRKQGKTNEAGAQYQRILRDFADQTQLAKLSRQDLAGMGLSAPAGSATSASAAGGASAEVSALAGQISGIEQLKGDPEEQARAVLAIFPDETLKRMLVNLPQLQEQEARLKANPKLAYNDLGPYHIAIAPDLELAQLERHGTNLLTDAEHELSMQLSWIGDRVNFIMANQKARLKVLQLASGASEMPAISNAALQTQKQLLDEEIKIVDQQLQSQQARVKLGVLSSEELAPTQMKLLELKRQRAALDTGQFISPQTSPEPNDEDKALAGVQTMVQNTPDMINGPNNPLGGAANQGQLRVVTFLLEHGANVNGSRNGDPPLVLAAENDQVTMVELLLNRGADINIRNPGGSTALAHAVRNGYKSVVEVLLAHHADVNAKSQGDTTPLHTAAQTGYADLAGLLITNGADVNATDQNGYTPLLWAAVNGHVAVMELLLAHKATVNSTANDGQTPLDAAVQRGKLDAAALLLKNGADVTAKQNGSMPLHIAIGNGDKEMVKLLLENGADPNARISSYSFTSRGMSFGQVADVTPLIMSVMNRQPDIVNLLAAHKADINATDAAGDTALTVLAGIKLEGQDTTPHRPGGAMRPGLVSYSQAPMVTLKSQLTIADTLLGGGADVNSQNNNQQSALNLAVLDHSLELVKLLLQHKAKVDILDKDGWTPLQRAVQQPRADIAAMLLDAGANPNDRFPQDNGMPQVLTGQTPLGAAVASDDKPLVEVLLSHKADPNLADDQGKTPLLIAKQRSKELLRATGLARTPAEITELLLKAGANDNLHRLSTICVSRGDDERIGFARVSNLPNHFSLLDLITGFYAPPLHNSGPPNGMTIQELPGLAFPDFGRIRINRLLKDGRTNVISVDLNQLLASGDCSKDIALEWGDMVEIPEADHNINEQWTGLSGQAAATLRKCAAAQVAIIVKGQTNLVTLRPVMYRRNSPSNPGSPGGFGQYGMPGFGGNGTIYYGDQIVGSAGFSGVPLFNPGGNPAANQREQPSFWLYDVVHDANVILTSSDLSRVKVTRKDAAARKPVEMTFDLQKNDPANALWLRDGDVIELPEKP